MFACPSRWGVVLFWHQNTVEKSCIDNCSFCFVFQPEFGKYQNSIKGREKDIKNLQKKVNAVEDEVGQFSLTNNGAWTSLYANGTMKV